MSFVFIITSTIKPTIGVIDSDVRYEQTLKTVESIRNKVEGAYILLVDSSPQQLYDHQYRTLQSECDSFISLTDNPQSNHLSSVGAKSLAETYVMMVAIDHLIKLQLPHITRVFKLTGRGELTDDFDTDYYNQKELQGKLVFKKSVQSWMNSEWKLVDTRIWSFCYTLLLEINDLLPKVFERCYTTGQDVEHSYYALVDKNQLIEKDIMGFKCQISSTGNWQYD